MKARELMSLAEEARRASYSPYSKFAVGAALLTRSGNVVLGCNVENSSFGLACCAERTAVFKAISDGEREFVAIAVTAGGDRGAAPCGACRQVLHEFAPDMPVHYRNAAGRIVTRKVSQLLLDGFRFPKRKRGAK